MVSFSIDTKDLRRLERELQKDSSDVKKDVRTAIIETAFEVRNNAIDAIQRGSKTGYVYEWRGVAKGLKPDSFRKVKGKVIPVKIRNKPHRASKSGEAPATDTGNLVNSIKVKEKISMRADVVADAKYSGYLEDDLNRKFMEPAYDKAESFLDKALGQAIERALR